jgi:DNA-binding MarR family transcriptional regulator
MTPAKDPGPAKDSETRADLLDSIMGDIAAIMRHVADWHVPEFLAVDVTMSQAKLLYLVTTHPGIVMSALAAQLGVGLSTVSGLVDRLVEHGYLERREDPADRRQQRVTVTPEGASVVERMREMNEHQLRTLLAGMSVLDLRVVGAGIAALSRHASDIDPSRSQVRDDATDPSRPRTTERTPA